MQYDEMAPQSIKEQVAAEGDYEVSTLPSVLNTICLQRIPHHILEIIMLYYCDSISYYMLTGIFGAARRR